MTLLDENISILAEKWGQFLRKKKLKCAVAESCTGGGIAFALTGISGSSEWFERGLVTYSNLSKQELLGVPENILQTYGAVSQETAAKMAEGVLAKTPVDFAISVTGIAGPVGTVWFGFATTMADTKTTTQYFTGSRESIRLASIHFILEWGYDVLHESFPA
jgi:nicotinamide-nucleotide amidase